MNELILDAVGGGQSSFNVYVLIKIVAAREWDSVKNGVCLTMRKNKKRGRAGNGWRNNQGQGLNRNSLQTKFSKN